MIDVLEDISTKEFTDIDEGLYQLQNNFVEYISEYRYIDQIRYINSNGDEKVRVDNSPVNIDIISKERLQNKRHRYYFSSGIQLKPGELYISPIDLNLEYHSIETPYKMMIRFITPIYRDGRIKGVIVINCNINTLLNILKLDSISSKSLNSSNRPESHGQLIEPTGITTWRTINFRDNILILRSTIDSGTLEDSISAFTTKEYTWLIPVVILIELLYIITVFYITYMRNRRKSVERELKEAENRHRIISDMVSEVAFVLNERWKLLWLSSGAYFLSGYSDNELLSTPSLLKLVHPADRAKIIYSIKNAKVTATKACEHRILTHDGSIRWVATFFRYEILDSGKKQYYGAIQDITDKKRTSGELEAIVLQRTKELQLVTKAVEQSASSIIITDRKGYIKYCNPEFFRSTGYDIDEVINRELYFMEDGHSYNLVRTILEEGKPWQGEVSSLNKRGESIIELVSISPVMDHMNIISDFILVKEDITQLKRTQNALSRSEKRYSLLFKTMLQGVVYQDGSGAIIEVNPAAEKILGLTVDQLSGRTSVDPRWRALRQDGTDFPGDQHPAMLALKTGKDIEDVTMGVFHPDSNSYRWILVNAKPLFRDGESTPYQVYTTFNDITRRKMMEERLIEARSRAESSAKSKSTFLANMSHEIRTPMNAILGYIDLVLESKKLLKRDRSHLDIAKKSAKGLLHIINDVLDISKLEAGKMTIEHKKFNIKRLIDDVTSQLLCIIPDSIDLKVHYNNDFTYCVMGDQNRLRQVLINLVGNAVKFTNEGFINIEVEINEDNYIHFNIVDSGIGMNKDQIKHIFDPFNQADNSTARLYGGTGLGTSICKELVNLMGGEITVESEPGIGSNFEFTIPMKVTNCGLVCQKKCDYYIENNISELLLKDGQYRILIVEDVEENAKLLQLRLERQNHSIIICSNGEEAIKAFEKYDLDLIIMDIQMPIMDGLTATRIIREIEGLGEKHIPIIALTASVMPQERESYLQKGISEVLAKPIDFNKLFIMIGKLMEDSIYSLGEKDKILD